MSGYPSGDNAQVTTALCLIQPALQIDHKESLDNTKLVGRLYSLRKDNRAALFRHPPAIAQGTTARGNTKATQSTTATERPCHTK